MGWKFEYSGRENWCTCDDEYDTKEEAIEAGREWFKDEDPEVEWFDVGRVKKPDIPKLNAYWILDDLGESMYEQCGEASEHWLNSVKKEERDRLEELVNEAVLKWIEESGNMPNFYVIVDIDSESVNG